MSKVAVVYWSGTGNTAAMAGAVEEGAKKRGAEVSVFGPEKFTADMVSEYDGSHSDARRWGQKCSRSRSLILSLPT